MISWTEPSVLSTMRRARAWVEVDLAAIAHNVRALKSLLPPATALMCVVKANAYGHGAVTVARQVVQAGATWLGVATVPEGIELRQAGIAVPILVMGAVNDPVEVRAIAHWQLQPAITSPKQALVFSETLAANYERDPAAERLPLPVHLQLDTGMSRLGFSWRQSVELARFVRQLPHLKVVSVYSHLATADSVDPGTMRLQHQRFEQAIADLKAANLLPPMLHFANSAATLTDAKLHYDMVRVGLSTYGLYPAPHLQSKADLRPSMSVKARITHLRNIEAGAGVSYGHKFVAPKPMRIAVAGIGYADGLPRLLSNRLQVAIAGQLVPQIGTITMDQIMIDVSTLDSVQEGDIVTLLGQVGPHRLSADDWADLTGTISWEILCGFRHRLPRMNSTTPSALSPLDLFSSDLFSSDLSEPAPIQSDTVEKRS